MIGSPGPEGDVCSRANCTAAATAQINWRNPRIHGEDRVKVWFACREHETFLRDYLASRDFPVLVTDVGSTVDRLVLP